MGDYWFEHGNDPVTIPLIDLASLVARLIQIRDEGTSDTMAFMLADRVITCDLVRLVKYLPEGAYVEMGGTPGLVKEGT